MYIDDFGSFTGCRAAVNKFRSENMIYEPMMFIREDKNLARINFEAVWWRKRRHSSNRGAVITANRH